MYNNPNYIGIIYTYVILDIFAAIYRKHNITRSYDYILSPGEVSMQTRDVADYHINQSRV